MSNYIDADRLKAEIERLKSVLTDQLCSQGNILGPDWVAGGNKMLNEISSVISSLQQEAKEEEKERKKRYDESFTSYWKCVIDIIDKKRVLPSFKGQLLHDFKNELHTMKQIVGLINHPEIHEGLFDKLALVFATWGGYHFHPKESLPEDAIQQEQPKGNLEYWLEHFGMPKENIDNCITQIAQGYGACRYLEGIQHGAEAVNEIAKQEQPVADLDALVDEAFDKYSSIDGYGQLSASFNRAELYSFIKKITRKEETK